jgi:hypothetical protein
MQSDLGVHVACYMGMNVVEEHSGSVFAGAWKMEAICADCNVSTKQSDCTVP